MKKALGSFAIVPLLCLLPAAVGVGGCAGAAPPRGSGETPRRVPNKPVIHPHPPDRQVAEPSERGFTVLSFNDTYRLEGVEGGARGG
ncbi:MAG: hypothetical protein OES47_15680, partial [Acidobacteriota bacterium]|nr:hypothetical protein [Acidobacteriota bacterium]